MNRCLRVLGVIMATFCASPAVAQQRVTLRMLPPVGQTTHYRLSVKLWVSAQGLPKFESEEPIVTEIMFYTQRVLHREGGLWTVATHVDSSIMVSGRRRLPFDSLRGEVVREVMDSLGGRHSSAVTTPPDANPTMLTGVSSGGRLGFHGVHLPVRPVRVAESWVDPNTAAVQSRGGGALTKAPTTYRLDRLEREGNHRVAVISFTTPISVRGAGGSYASRGRWKGVARLDIDGGRLLQWTVDQTLEGGGGGSRSLVELDRLH